MNDLRLLPLAKVSELVAQMRAAGTRVLGPRDGGDFGDIEHPDDLRLAVTRTLRSVKEALWPPAQVLFRWRQSKSDIEIDPASAVPRSTVVFGVLPCDAAAMAKLDHVMGWDYKDDLYLARRQATTLVALTCDGGDGACFCAGLGASPDSTRGADLMLTKVAAGFFAEPKNEKGETLVREYASCFASGTAMRDEAATNKAAARAKAAAQQQLAISSVQAWTAKNFDHPLWSKLALRCHGCGVCAAVCPTCHCFDIVDEPEGITSGTRRRHWDTCQNSRFTQHASGHNPRADQGHRCRQRILHKFAVYPQRFGELLCTGCGRCVRACPAGMDVREALVAIAALAKEGAT